MLKLDEILDCVPYILAFMAAASLAGIAATSPGTPGDHQALGQLGPSAAFTCKWVSPDQKLAVFTTATGSTRLVDLEQLHSHVEVGGQYRLKSAPLHRFANQHYLVRD